MPYEVDLFNDDSYEVDLEGLQLADDEDRKLAAAFGCNDCSRSNVSSDDDDQLASAYGYNLDVGDPGEVLHMEGGHSDSCKDFTATSLDDRELAAEFGYEDNITETEMETDLQSCSAFEENDSSVTSSSDTSGEDTTSEVESSEDNYLSSIS